MSVKITLRLFVIICLSLFLAASQKSVAQIPSNCFAIQGILVDACGVREGENEMVSFQIGPNDLNVSNITVAWPPATNPYLGICQDATTAVKVAAFNRTIQRCGLIVEPVAGVLPAGRKVILFCSEAVDTTLSSFASLQDTIVAIFQCVGNTQGHFKNFGIATGTRAMTISFSSPAGCSETVTYNPESLRDQTGALAAQDGEGVHFTNSGVASYYWGPCMPPVIAPFINAGSNISICRNTVTAHLSGSSNNIQGLHWFGGQGTFGRTDTLRTTYTPSPLDVFPLYLYLSRKICATDSIVDSVLITLGPPAPLNVSARLCGGQSYSVGTHTYTATGIYSDTLLSSGGCDSIIITNLRVDTTITQVNNLQGCTQVTYNGTVYTSSTVLHQNIPYVLGCDSLVAVTVITIANSVLYSQSPTICQGQSFIVGTKSYSSPGFFIDTFRNAALGGCDSIVHTLLSVVAPYPDILVINDTCTGFYKGVPYSASTTIYDTLRSQATGCDSVFLTVTVNVYIPPVISNPQSARICPGSSFFAGGQYQTTAGIYRDTVRTAGGCDSMITITNLSVINPQRGFQRYDSCKTVTINGSVYSHDTIVQTVIPSSLGCDSIIESDTVHIKGSTITVLSTALLPITEGDSTQLIINPTGNYSNIVWSPNQWINNRYLAAPTVLPDVSTAYIVNATDANGCDISAQIIVTVNPSNTTEFVMPDAFTPNGDGKNDSIGPILNPNAQLTSYHVYNRWGELVFDMDQSGTNTWDGTYKNVQQPGGNYMYFITVTSSHGVATNKEGNISLFR
jgi:gliding motility-associated-like protein